MFFQIRDIGEFFRGDATPFQLLSATILAGIISFLPGFSQAPGLMVAAVLLFLILNTNFFVAGFVAAGGKLLSLSLLPVTFELGHRLIDSLATPLCTRLINGPVTAWFGFDNYVATGGLILGAGYGLLTGIVVVALVTGFRSQMARASQSGTGEKLTANPLAGALAWVFFGSKVDENWEALAKRKIGKPVRITGLVLTAGLAALLFAAPRFTSPQWLARLACTQIAPSYGATVNMERMELDLASGKLAVTKLALCNPNDLASNTFEAARLEANLSTADLLSRKYALDRLQVSGAKVGAPRNSPGHRVGRVPKPSQAPDTAPDADGESVFSIDTTLKQAQEWKERLAQVKKWLEKFSPSPADKPAGRPGETLEERLRRQARELGYANVFASHRIEKSPRFTIRELVAQGVTIHSLPGEVLDVAGSNLSTQPQLVTGASTVRAESRSGKLGFTLTLDQDTGPLTFHYDELPVDTVRGWMSNPDQFPFTAGNFKLSGNGTLTGTQINLPVQVTPVGSQIRIAGAPRPCPQIPFALLLTGSLDNPRIRPELKGMLRGAQDQLLQQGTEILKTKIQEKVGDKLKGLFQPRP